MGKATKHFNTEELVSKQVYDVIGDDAIKLFDPKVLESLEAIREILNVPLICNNWVEGGSRDDCGYRDKLCTIGASKSLHKYGKAFDLISNKLTAQEMRDLIIKNQDKLPHNIRLEDEVSWLHVDVRDKGVKVYLFKA
jgi:hypothetical protein